jgi:hypothetical protein
MHFRPLTEALGPTQVPHPAETHVANGTHILQLPDAVLTSIFETIPQSTSNLDLVCRRFLWINAYSCLKKPQLDRKSRFDEILTQCALLSREELLEITGKEELDPIALSYKKSYSSERLKLQKFFVSHMNSLDDPLLPILIENKIVKGSLCITTIEALLQEKERALTSPAMREKEVYISERYLQQDRVLQALSTLDSFKKLRTTVHDENAQTILKKITAMRQLQSVNVRCQFPHTTSTLTIPPEIECMKMLKELKISGSAALSFPEEMVPLESLSITDNQKFTSIPKSIGRIKTLTSLVLKGTGISSLPPELAATSLKKLDIFGNPISVIPDWVWGITTLQELYLPKKSPCALISDEIDLPLNTLMAAGCWSLPILQLNLNSLKIVDLSSSSGSPSYEGVIPGILSESPLEELRMSSCEITEIPRWIGKVTTLKRLYLEGNQIRAIPDELGRLPLEELNLNCNPIVTGLFPKIGHMKTLRKIDMAGTRLAKLCTVGSFCLDQLVDLPLLERADFRFVRTHPDESTMLTPPLQQLQMRGILKVGPFS